MGLSLVLITGQFQRFRLALHRTIVYTLQGYALSVAVLLSAIWILLYLESSPILYYAYVLFPILFGAEIIRRRASCYEMFAALQSSSSVDNISHVILCLVALELMVQ